MMIFYSFSYSCLFRTPNKELLRKLRRKKSVHSKKGKNRQGIMRTKSAIKKGKAAANTANKKK